MEQERHRSVDTSPEIQRLYALIQEARTVDLCDFGELKFFLFKNDFFYDTVPEESRHYELTKRDIRRVASREFTPIDVEQLYSGNDALGRIMAHFWLNRLMFTYMDIGCPYGITAITAARIIEASGHENQTICFEPGMGGGLVSQNIKLNGFEKRIRYENTAVSDHCLPVILSTSLHHAEGNHIVNREVEKEDRSFVVENTTLDTYLAKNQIAPNIILKVDTEGAEYEILKGMQKALRERCIVSIWEFQPGFLSSRIRPEYFLAFISKDSYLLDIGQEHVNRTEATLIDADRFSEFVDRIFSREDAWTDILVVPRKLPNVGNLLEKFGIEENAFASKEEPRREVWFGSGWFEEEPNGRWTSREPEIYLRNPDKKNLVLECYLNPDTLKNQYDNTLILTTYWGHNTFNEVKIENRNDFQGAFTIELDTSDIEAGTILIALDRTFSPAKVGQSGDTRELGIFVKNIGLR